MPVIAAFKLDDLVPTSKTPREPDAAHGGLGAAVDHAHFFHRGNQIADRLRHIDFQWIRDSEAQAIGSSATDGGNHGVRRVAEDGGPPCSHVVNEFPAFDGEDAGPLGSCDEERLAADTAKSTNRRVHTAGNNASCVLEEVV